MRPLMTRKQTMRVRRVTPPAKAPVIHGRQFIHTWPNWPLVKSDSWPIIKPMFDIEMPEVELIGGGGAAVGQVGETEAGDPTQGFCARAAVSAVNGAG
jgi:hypothetical protein